MKHLLFISLLSAFLLNSNSQNLSVSGLGLKPPAVNNCTGVKDQYMSGTCWSFSSNSFLESEVLRIKKEKIDLSEMFVARYSYIRKIETYLENKGSNFFTSGGQFHDVVWVLKNYGIVPEDQYNGRPGKAIRHDHAELDTLIKNYVAELLQSQTYHLKKEHYRYLDSVFDKHLGIIPSKFTYAGKIYNPKSFLTGYLNINPDDYVEITSYTHHPFYKSFVLEDKYNWTGDSYYNIPLSEFISVTNIALKKGYTVGWDGDVDEPGFVFENGLAYLPGKIINLPKERQNTFNDKTTDIDHMMHIVAVTKDKNRNDWYYIKNSWGNYSNNLNGFMFMSKDYFAVKTGAIFINKNALSSALKQKLKL